MHAAVVKVHAAVKAKRAAALLSETVFTLEAIQRADRRKFFSTYVPQVAHKEIVHPNGTLQISFSIGPDKMAHPGNNPYLTSHLKDALALGFRLMKCPRIAGVQNPDLKEEWFALTGVDATARHNTFGEVARKLEAAGVGSASIVAIGKRFSASNEHWTSGLAKAPASEDNAIAAAVAEWADGDTVCAHIAYGNRILCTRDVASAGHSSVFSPQNRAWLKKDYNVDFATPAEVAGHL